MLDAVDLSGGEATWAALVVLSAAYVRGLTGFALSAVFVAGMSFVLDPVEAVPLALCLEVAASTIQGRSIRDDVDWRRLGVLFAAAVVGNPIGVLILTSADPEILRGVTFGVLFILSLALLRTGEGSVVPTLSLFFGIGVVAGVVNGATALSGLVLVLAMSFLTITPIEMRSTLIVYFFVSDLAIIVLLAATGETDTELLMRTLLALPLLGLGIWAGSNAFRRTTPETFRRITLGLLIAISLAGLVRVAL